MRPRVTIDGTQRMDSVTAVVLIGELPVWSSFIAIGSINTGKNQEIAR